MWEKSAKYLFCLMLLMGAQIGPDALAKDNDTAKSDPYLIQPGDVLDVSVWQEPDLQREVTVEPDGTLAFPLAGELSAVGKTVVELRKALTERLVKYMPDAVVTVAVKQPLGNKIYVIGKVNRPGEFLINRYVDVMQALSMAGGTTPYADLNDILILRRTDNKQVAIPFKYGQVEDGRHLEQNRFLMSGDTIVVP